MKLEFSRQSFEKKAQVSFFFSKSVQCERGRTDRHDGGNSRLSQFSRTRLENNPTDICFVKVKGAITA